MLERLGYEDSMGIALILSGIISIAVGICFSLLFWWYGILIGVGMEIGCYYIFKELFREQKLKEKKA